MVLPYVLDSENFSSSEIGDVPIVHSQSTELSLIGEADNAKQEIDNDSYDNGVSSMESVSSINEQRTQVSRLDRSKSRR